MELTAEQLTQLQAASGEGHPVEFSYPDSGEIWKGTIVAEVSNISGNYKNVLQKIKPDDENDQSFYYRLAYYAYSTKANGPVSAQRPLIVSTEISQDLLTQARALGWDMFPETEDEAFRRTLEPHPDDILCDFCENVIDPGVGIVLDQYDDDGDLVTVANVCGVQCLAGFGVKELNEHYDGLSQRNQELRLQLPKEAPKDHV